jgi:hypothetical protein
MTITKGALTGMGIGAAIGYVPGVVAWLCGPACFLGASVGHDASSLVRWLGLLIGGAAGSIVGAMAATANIEGDADVEPVEPNAAKT